MITTDWYNISEIKDELEGLSLSEKLELLSEKEEEMEERIEELEGYLSEISDIKDEIENQLRENVDAALQEAGHHLSPDNPLIELGGTSVAIYVSSEGVNLILNSASHQRAYQKLVANLLPTFSHEANSFFLACVPEDLCHNVVKTVETLVDAKGRFEEIDQPRK